MGTQSSRMKIANRLVSRVVLDTNVLLSALVFNSGVMARLRSLWMTEHIQPYASKETIQELIRVLANKKFKLDAADQESLLSDYLPFAQIANTLLNVPKIGLPICRDPKDQMLLDLAVSAKVEYLVTGDQDLLVLADTPDLGFKIVKPLEFLALHQLIN